MFRETAANILKSEECLSPDADFTYSETAKLNFSRQGRDEKENHVHIDDIQSYKTGTV